MKKWTPIKGYESLYEINELGIIRSCHKRNFQNVITVRIDRAGYLTTRLSKSGNVVTKLVHRLIAENFIPNPDNKNFVNHKNGNKVDIRIENLEWVTHSENVLHAYKTGLCSLVSRQIPVIDTCSGNSFPSIKKAAEFHKIKYATCKGYLNGDRTNPTCLAYLNSTAA